MGQTGQSSYTSRYTQFQGRLDASSYLNSLLELAQMRGRLEALGDAAANDRRAAGGPWREQAVNDLKGDDAAIERWLGEQRAVAWCLPSGMRPLVPVLALDPRAPIHVPPSCALSASQAGRLYEIAEQTLTVGASALSRADRVFKHRTLPMLEPVRNCLVLADYRVSSLGGVAAVCATSAAVGSWVAVQPTVGYPAIGMVATYLEGCRVGIEPFDLPRAKTPDLSEREFTAILRAGVRPPRFGA
jgi:hypothetical protein